MKNGAWTPMHFARFSALREYDNHRLFSKENGIHPRDLVSRTEFIRLLNESGTVDPFQFTHNFIKKQTEEARKNNISISNKRKSHDYKGKGKEMEELDDDDDADRFPIRKGGYHELDLNDPEVRADIEECKRKVFAYRDKREKEEKEKQKKNKKKENGRALIKSGHRNSDLKNQNQKANSKANPIVEMKNGAWTPMHFARFSAVRTYDNHRLFSKKDGIHPRDLVSRKEFIRLLNESGTADPFQFTQNFIKKQTEEARKNNISISDKRKSHDYKGKEKEMEELDDDDDDDDDRFPIRKGGYHDLDLNDPEVKARIEEKKKRVFAYRDKLEKEKAVEKEKRRMRRRSNSSSEE